MGEPEQSVRYQYADHLGSAGLELDEEGSVITFEEYYPFGSTSFQSGRSSAEVKQKRYRYTGKERDEESGLAYHGARFGLVNKSYLAHFIAQAAHEPGGFKLNVPVERSTYKTLEGIGATCGYASSVYKKAEANPGKYVNRSILVLNAAYANKGGNGDEASGDGYKFRGRGYFQLTLHDNYENFTDAYNKLSRSHLNLVEHPELVASDKKMAVISALWYFQKYTIPSIKASADFRKITKTINAKALGLKQRQEIYNCIVNQL